MRRILTVDVKIRLLFLWVSAIEDHQLLVHLIATDSMKKRWMSHHEVIHPRHSYLSLGRARGSHEANTCLPKYSDARMSDDVMMT